MRHLRREGRWLGVIGVIVVLALISGGYILSNERLASPFSSSYSVKAEFTNVAAVTPAVGAAVNVAGVRVGQVDGVTLRDGRGVLSLRIDPHKIKSLRTTTRATLVPNTPLKDMQVDLAPGRTGPALRHGAMIPLAQTTTPIDADELLHALDADTRTYLQSLIADVGAGVDHRGGDLRALLRSAGPTAAQMQRIGDLLASRRHELPALVHNLAVLTKAAGSDQGALRTLVSGSNATLGALAGQDAALQSSLAQLPGTLAQARDTITRAAPFTRSLRRTLLSLEPAIRRAPATLRKAPGALEGLLPLPPRQLIAFTNAVAPLSKTVRGASADLGAQIAPLKTAFEVINVTTNELAYNSSGKPGYLYWLAWFSHNADSLVSTEDAHGAVWRGLALVSCASASQGGPAGALLTKLLGTASTCP